MEYKEKNNIFLLPSFDVCARIAYNYNWVPWLIVSIYLALVHYGIQFMSGRNRRKDTSIDNMLLRQSKESLKTPKKNKTKKMYNKK